MQPMTHDAVARMIARLCQEHGRVTVDRAEDDAGVVLSVRARSQEPVQCLLINKRGKG
jgi:hypothetical protein